MKWLEQCIASTQYTIERKGDGGILVVGTQLGYYSRVVQTILNRWEPNLILSKELGDSWYEGSTKIFHQGGKFQSLTGCGQKSLLESTYVEYITSKPTLVFGISGDEYSSDSEVFRQIRQFTFLPRLLVEVSYYDAHPKFQFCKTLEKEEIPFTTVYWPGVDQYIHR